MCRYILQSQRMNYRFLLLLAIVCSVRVSLGQNTSNKADEPKAIAYDNGPSGQPSWDGDCNVPLPAFPQAPINIQNAQINPGLPIIQFSYSSIPLQYATNANNVKVAVHGQGGITLGTLGTYRLNEFHFHRPGEEAIGNHRPAMVIHMVHEKQGGSGEPLFAAIAILVEESSPSHPATPLASALIDRLTRNFPPPLTPSSPVSINPRDLLPPNLATQASTYYRYKGSLTTPPCSGDVTFYVLKTPIYLPAAQIEEFARRYPSPNSRNIQETTARHELQEKP
ncbi:MAG TPA: carbonic anhydrase family protein [Candidatus Angelobacter sp.]|nr:carbonic anhydrase family protein [Candidatus Angelobacter sp.]